MNPIHIFLAFCLFVGSVGMWGQDTSSSSLQKDSLENEFDILTQAFEQLHPGLYRYRDEVQIKKHFKKFKRRYSKSENLSEAFLTLTQFTSALQCGHTYPNYWNQKREIQQALFNGSDKLPFTFVIVEDAFLIQKNLSSLNLPEGSRMVGINGISTSKIMKRLLTYGRSDGDNILKKYADLGIKGFGKFEAFDVLFPMLYPPKNGKYEVEILKPDGSLSQMIVEAISRQERSKRLSELSDGGPNKVDELWSYYSLNEDTEYLKLGTFATWNMEMDWKKYLEDFFVDLKGKGSKNLILDIRGNEGGLDEVYEKLLTYLTEKPLALLRDQQWVRYQSVDQELRPYLEGWNPQLYELGEKVVKVNDRFFRMADLSVDTLSIVPSPHAFAGKIAVLIDAENSSATLFLSKLLRNNQLATLIGQQTGGNLMGTNGGQMFMLRLPYTGLEIDLPLIGYYPRQAEKNGGLKPDWEIARNMDFYLSKEDLDIQKALEILSN